MLLLLLLLLGLCRLLVILRGLDWGGGGAPACRSKHPCGGRALLHRLLHLLLQPAVAQRTRGW